MNILIDKVKEVLSSVLPITLIVVLFHFTIVPLETPVFVRFLLGALCIVLGLSIFLFGIDIGITPIGNLMGSEIAKSNKMSIITLAGLLLGFFISIAEPDLHILAGQIDTVTSGAVGKITIVLVVSVGIAVMVAMGLLRIVKNIRLRNMLLLIYGAIFVVSFFTTPEFLAISFDASGATTGAMTVPFILAISTGVATLKKDSKSSEADSFGLLAIASSGAILAVLIMSLFTKTGELTGSLEETAIATTSILQPFALSMKTVLKEVLFALLPIVLLFLLSNMVRFKLERRTFRKIMKGLLYTFLGLVLFLVGVNAGFMEVGSIVGITIASTKNYVLLVAVGFLLGLVTILAEPAVHVLTRQIEEVTSGSVKGKLVLMALSVGVAISVALSVLRIVVPSIQLWHYLLPGYLIAFILTFIVPDLFVGIAFDSGGVASGPMCATFILAFAQGAAQAIEGANVLVDGFGVIAMVAMTPLIALQILGLVFKIKSKKTGVKAVAKE